MSVPFEQHGKFSRRERITTDLAAWGAYVWTDKWQSKLPCPAPKK